MPYRVIFTTDVTAPDWLGKKGFFLFCKVARTCARQMSTSDNEWSHSPLSPSDFRRVSSLFSHRPLSARWPASLSPVRASAPSSSSADSRLSSIWWRSLTTKHRRQTCGCQALASKWAQACRRRDMTVVQLGMELREHHSRATNEPQRYAVTFKPSDTLRIEERCKTHTSWLKLDRDPTTSRL